MNLGEFVKVSLVEIIRGVTEAIEETKTSPGRAIINPTLAHAQHADPKEVEFDIAVTVQEESTIGGGGGISVMGLKVGASGDKGTSNTAISRITFSVPVSWPSVAKEQYVQTSRNLHANREHDPYA